MALGAGLMALSCKSESFSLYEGIETGIVSAKAYSHADSSYKPVPDSLRLRFQRQLRMLRCTVVSSGCQPQLETRLEATPARITIRYDMHNACVHVQAELFDVDIFISPVHPDTFQLLIEEVDFSSSDAAARQVVLNRWVDVRTLPGF